MFRQFMKSLRSSFAALFGRRRKKRPAPLVFPDTVDIQRQR